MKRELWLMPFLSAMFWGSCREQWSGEPHRDVRAAICGFCFTLMVMLAARHAARLGAFK